MFEPIFNFVNATIGDFNIRSIRTLDVAVVSVTVWALLKLIKATQSSKNTPLKGPPNESIIFGLGQVLEKASDAGQIYERWAEEYGVAYKVPSALGKSRIVLCDPKAIAHFFSKETFTYVLMPASKLGIETIAGRGLLWSHGESHRRQRKALAPAFSNVAIKRLTAVFYDSAYKAKAAWETLLESNPDGMIVEVQNWMNHISLDSIGIAGFSHNFASLEGKRSTVADVFDEFGTAKPSILFSIFVLLSPVFPWLIKMPSSRIKLIRKLNHSAGEISNVLLDRTRRELQEDANEINEDKSIIGLLIKHEDEDAEIHITQEEVMAQMKVLLLAGYETTSISLTWALIELSYDQKRQAKLRDELLQFSTDPSWDQLNSNLPYLDAVVHEILRLHPPLPELMRMAAEDDVIPLGIPVQTASGETVNHISVTKDTLITIPIRCMNRSTDVWGLDAKEFNPERWLGEDRVSGKAKDIQGHRHLLTFSDGPRTCLGKGFALAEFKAVLFVLIRNFTFEMRDGLDTKIERARGVLPRPTVAGEEGCRVPLRIRRVE